MNILALELVTTSHCLPPYFQAHPIKVFTEIPLKKSIVKTQHVWCYLIELSKFNIDYIPRSVSKWQILENFFMGFIGFHEPVPITHSWKPWKVIVDSSSCYLGGGKHTLVTRYGEEIHYMIRLAFKIPKNEEEWSIAGKTCMVKVLGGKRDQCARWYTSSY